LLTVVAAREWGAGRVYLVGTKGDEARMQVGRNLGVDDLIYLDKGDPLEQLLGLTGGEKATRVIDATGSASAVGQGLLMTARGGVYVSLGGQHPDVEVGIRPDYMLRNKIDIRFSHLGTGSYEVSRDIITSHRYALDSLITHEFRLDRGLDALKAMAERRDGCIKPVLVFDHH
jgi:threonine dehydrogenase-like Zn-dependent dehydrogenase